MGGKQSVDKGSRRVALTGHPDYKAKADIKWNFTKFLVNKYGMVVERFEPTENMENVEKKIEELL